MGMIEDAELRELFKVECQEHIQGLERGMLGLETDPLNKRLIEDVFREAHSLKGSSRMVGVKDVEIISHKIEDILSPIRKDTAAVTSEIVDRVCRALDSMKRFVAEAVTGVPAGIELNTVIDLLTDGSDVTKPPESHEAISSDAAGMSVAEASGGEGQSYRIDTVRVDTVRLDELAALTGELTVFKTRLHSRLREIDEAIDALTAQAHEAAALLAAPPSTDSMRPKTERGKGLFETLVRLKEAAYEDTSRFELIAAGLDDGVRLLRLLPFSTLFNLFPRAVRDMAREAGREVALIIEGGETGADKRIIEEMKDPLMHMLRNAVVHGIESPSEREASGKPRTGTITLRALRTEASILIEVKDDGRGLDMKAIRNGALKRRLITQAEDEVMDEAQIKSLIFASGFSTSAFVTETAGRGVGLDIVRANIERLKGVVEVESSPGAGCAFRVSLPATLATARMLIVEDLGRRYALPMDHIRTSIRVRPQDIFLIEGRQAIDHEGLCVSVARLSHILELPDDENERAGTTAKNEARPCVIITSGSDRLAVLVDELIDEQEVVLKQGNGPLKRVRNVTGSTILGSGQVCVILNPSDMIKTVHKRHLMTLSQPEAVEAVRKKAVLLVEDSITTRAQEKRILEGAGYEVVTAVDGLDAISLISTRSFDAVVSDIMMPNMDGLTLTARLRQDAKYKDMPIVLVTTLASNEDKKRGLEAGASAYIPKPSFDQKIFLDTLGRLL